MSKSDTVLNVAIVGLDSSHAVEFTRRIQAPDCEAELRVGGMRVTHCARMPSPFRSEADQDAFQARLEGWGIEVTRSVDDAIADADAIMVLNTDPAAHWPSIRKVASGGRPIYLDKPPADTLDNARAIGSLAVASGLRLFSASALRFAPELPAVRDRCDGVRLAICMGAFSTAAAGSSVVWYGIHAVEMLQQILGRGAQSVFAHEDEIGVHVALAYSGGRRGALQLTRGNQRYSALAQGENCREYAPIEFRPLYTIMLNSIREFFRGGEAPATWEESMEAQAILHAIEQSLATGTEAPVFFP